MSYHSATGPPALAAGATTWRHVADRVKALADGALADEAQHLVYEPRAAQDCAMVLAERLMIGVREAIAPLQFKLIVNCSVLQRGAGLSTFSSVYLDAVHDGSTMARFENESVVVIATIWGIRLA
jgi:hypothetical protein